MCVPFCVASVVILDTLFICIGFIHSTQTVQGDNQHHDIIMTSSSYIPVEVHSAGHWLPCVLGLVVAELVAISEHKEALPADTTLFDQPPLGQARAEEVVISLRELLGGQNYEGGAQRKSGKTPLQNKHNSAHLSFVAPSSEELQMWRN